LFEIVVLGRDQNSCRRNKPKIGLHLVAWLFRSSSYRRKAWL